jgi:hypothetical protein
MFSYWWLTGKGMMPESLEYDQAINIFLFPCSNLIFFPVEFYVLQPSFRPSKNIHAR